jgi:hypothetical protein
LLYLFLWFAGDENLWVLDFQLVFLDCMLKGRLLYFSGIGEIGPFLHSVWFRRDSFFKAGNQFEHPLKHLLSWYILKEFLVKPLRGNRHLSKGRIAVQLVWLVHAIRAHYVVN